MERGKLNGEGRGYVTRVRGEDFKVRGEDNVG